MKWVFLGLALFWSAFAHAQTVELAPEARECFEWFQTLGYPDLTNAPWVEVWTGHSSRMHGVTSADTQEGFVIHSKNDRFTVIDDTLSPYTCAKTKPRTPAEERIDYEVRNFHEYAVKTLGEMKQSVPKMKNLMPLFQIRQARQPTQFEVFFLAYASFQKKDLELANALFAESKRRPSYSQTPDDSPKTKSIHESLEEEVAALATREFLSQWGGNDVAIISETYEKFEIKPRKEVLPRLRQVLKAFPHHPELERLRQLEQQIDSMVREDEQHPALSDETLAKLPSQERIKEWIYRLRDQRGLQMTLPGTFSVFIPLAKTAASNLLEIGYDAVPQLMAALDDERPSRAVDTMQGNRVLTIAECACEILERLCGETFIKPDGKISAAETKKAAAAWWTKFQAKGEKAYLVEAISSGTRWPYDLIELLKAKYPNEVEPALLAGLEHIEGYSPPSRNGNPALLEPPDLHLEEHFIKLLGELHTPKVTDFMIRSMTEGKTLQTRLRMAAQLWEQHHPSVLPAILAEWNRILAHPELMGEKAASDLLIFLIYTGKSEAITAVVRDRDSLSAGKKFIAVEAMGQVFAKEGDGMSAGEVISPSAPETNAREAAEWFLVHELENTFVRHGMSGGYGDFDFDDPRTCDFALWALHELNPQRYAFTGRADRKQRNAERLAAANQWRKDHQESPLEQPALSKLSPKESLKITSVELMPARGNAGAFVKAAMDQKGRMLDKETIPKLIRSFAQDGTTSLSGVTLQAARDDDLTGVRLIVSLDMGKNSPEIEWSVDYDISLGDVTISSGGTGADRKSALQKGRWKDISDAIKKLIHSPANKPFEISVTLRPNSED